MNDERLYPGGSRVMRALEESVNELSDEMLEGRREIDVTYEVGDAAMEAAYRVVERWYRKGSVAASEMLTLRKSIDQWDEWRRYGGE